uniref:Unannotated protein n=1 Tax=freshwater metagenome TaxID=449393 RepID=A0A6J7NAR3_9ZZZZ
MLTPIGPGRYSAISADTSSKEFGAIARMSARIGVDSSWNTPIVSPRPSSSYVRASSSESPSTSKSGSCLCWIIFTVSVMTSRFLSPRKSILRRPSSSTPFISYCVTIGEFSGLPPGSGLRWIGRYSVSGPRVITTAAA